MKFVICKNLNPKAAKFEKEEPSVDSIDSIDQPFPKRQILDSSKLKDFADDNLKFDENGRKLSKRVENTVGKEENARYEQFLLSPQCFQNTYTVDT